MACRDRGLFHIHDEAYEHFTYDEPHVSPGAFADAVGHTISMWSLSKAFGFASWRIGYMTIPEALFDAVNKIQDTNLICPAAVSQHAALAALDVGRPYCDAHVRVLAQVRALVYHRLGTIGDLVEAPDARGAFYVLLRVKTALDPYVLAERLIREHKVATIPARPSASRPAARCGSPTARSRPTPWPRASIGSSPGSARSAHAGIARTRAGGTAARRPPGERACTRARLSGHMVGTMRRWLLRAGIVYLVASVLAGVVLGEFAVQRGHLLGAARRAARADAVAAAHGPTSSRPPPRRRRFALAGWLFTRGPPARGTVVVTHGPAAGATTPRPTPRSCSMPASTCSRRTPAATARAAGSRPTASARPMTPGAGRRGSGAVRRAHCVYALGSSMGGAHALMAEAAGPDLLRDRQRLARTRRSSRPA